MEADAREWLAGNDPFTTRSNYSIAKELSERNPGHSIVSTHKRIERKLSRGPYNRRWFALVWAENLSRNQGPHGAHIRALGALSDLPESDRPDLRSEEHTSELQSLMRISYAVLCLKKKKQD